MISIPVAVNPLTELTGERCFVGQRGPVWNLGGDVTGSGGPIERTCSIPFGKSVLMPVLNAECSTAEGNADPGQSFATRASDLAACATGLIDQVVTAEAAFGPAGSDLEALEVERVTTTPFDITIPDAPFANVLGLDGADPNLSLSVADGFWVLVPPPAAPGSFELTVFGEFDAVPQDGVPDFVQDVTYRIEFVVPQ